MKQVPLHENKNSTISVFTEDKNKVFHKIRHQ
jgi:hypothetical protein